MKKLDTEKAIFELLQQKKLSASEIAENLGVSYTHITKSINLMIDNEQPICVVDWVIVGTSYTRVFGIGRVDVKKPMFSTGMIKRANPNGEHARLVRQKAADRRQFSQVILHHHFYDQLHAHIGRSMINLPKVLNLGARS